MKKWLLPLAGLVAILLFVIPGTAGAAGSEELIRMDHTTTACDWCIEIRKQAEGPDSRTVAAGSDVDWEIQVTNIGDHFASDVTVSDPLEPNCDLLIGTLAAGASVTYTCTTSNVLAGFTNIATVTTSDDGGREDSDPSTVVIQADYCESKLKPSVLTMELVGGGADDSNHSQDSGKVNVSGSDVLAGPVYIIATDKDDPYNRKAHIWFQGTANIGETFEVSAIGVNKDDKLKGNTLIFIYDADPSLGGTLIQSIEFHTSCSQTLNSGDQFGAVELVDFVGVQRANRHEQREHPRRRR